jgi:hypothetical protein
MRVDEVFNGLRGGAWTSLRAIDRESRQSKRR